MKKVFFKKVIAQTPDDLRIISALCSEAKVKQSDIKFLKNNRVFLMPVKRIDKENEKTTTLLSILKFDFIDNTKAKNINQTNEDNVLELLTIDIFKKENIFEIILLFLNNRAITLETEVVEVVLEDIKQNDKSN